MRRATVIVASALALVLLPWCGMREPGLEVEVDLDGVANGASGTLDVTAVDLLVCPDVDPRTAWRALVLPAHARAHDGTMGAGAALAFPSPHAQIVLPVPPGSYCDVRLAIAGLVLSNGSAPAREVVLRLVDESGNPTRITLAQAPTRASVEIALGSFDASDSPEHALSRVFSGAVAQVR
jgi:hypothetical protein